MSLFKRKTIQKKTYDLNLEKPVIRSSICTGEKTAGFRELATGKFREEMLIRTDRDLAEFKSQYGITGDIETVY